jgi:8-oxo-dGTP pyrophosphatase MutT (NUDIX family)
VNRERRVSDKAIVEKVIAYITREDHLLVFSHPHHPEAGIQVPAGTIEPGESPEDAVLREAREETGLQSLEIRAFLGVQEQDLAEFELTGMQRRYFFHLECHQETPAMWRHYEMHPSDGSPESIEFELFWVELSRIPELVAAQGRFLHLLREERS